MGDNAVKPDWVIKLEEAQLDERLQTMHDELVRLFNEGVRIVEITRLGDELAITRSSPSETE